MYPTPEIITRNEVIPIPNDALTMPTSSTFTAFKNKKIEPIPSPTPITIKTIPNSFDLKFNILIVILY